MPDVLSQSEVDALLAAVGTPADGQKTGAAARVPEGAVEYYDFLRPERISARELRALGDLHELSARAIAAALSGAVRLPVQVRFQTSDQVSWGEFLMNLSQPTCFGVVRAEVASGDGGPQGGEDASGSGAGVLAFEMAYAAVFPMIERLLGGGAEHLGTDLPARAMTEIETRVAGTLIEIALGALERIWQRAGPVGLQLEQLETNPQIVPVAPPTEMAVLATFDVSVGEGSGSTAHLCVPLAPLGGLVRRLAAAGAHRVAARTPGEAERIRRALGRVPVRVSAFLGGVPMRLRDILNLSVGSIIETGRGETDDLLVCIGGKPKLRASLGEFRGRRAVSVVGR